MVNKYYQNKQQKTKNLQKEAYERYQNVSEEEKEKKSVSIIRIETKSF